MVFVAFLRPLSEPVSSRDRLENTSTSAFIQKPEAATAV
jgi:hypothetical protein